MILFGNIKLNRKIFKWRWYKNRNTKELFIHLLLLANYEQQDWGNITIERGQCVTSISELSSNTSLSEQEVRTALKNLKSTGEITSKSTNKYTLITVTNYDTYQRNQQTNNKQTTNKKQTTNNNVIKNNKYNKNKKEKRESTHSFSIFGTYSNVKMSESDYGKLVDDFGVSIAEDYIKRLDVQIETKGSNYRNHSATIRKWIDEDGVTKKEKECKKKWQ